CLHFVVLMRKGQPKVEDLGLSIFEDYRSARSLMNSSSARAADVSTTFSTTVSSAITDDSDVFDTSSTVGVCDSSGMVVTVALSSLPLSPPLYPNLRGSYDDSESSS